MAVDAIRALIRRARCGALATALAADEGWPYVSLVTLACDTDLSPILLLSNLSDHTRNLQADARASLMLEEASRLANPQTGARVTLVGRVVADAEPRLRRRFLARHPGAALYADFADFHVFRLAIERVHSIGGFGRAEWLPGEDLLQSEGAAAIAACEETVLATVNTLHAASIATLASRRLGLTGEGWEMVGIDPDGCDLGRKSRRARVSFTRPATDTAALWEELHHLFVTAAGAADPPSPPA